jgi:multicomponent Na+:H+ antiporter subunit A
VTERRSWAAELGLTLDLRLDAFSLLMVLLISGIGLLICWYARSYFTDEPHLGRLAGLLTAFAGAMLGVVLADNLLLLYVCWELTSVTSYLLIGFDDRDPAARKAALHAILVTGAGGLAMLAGFVLLAQAAGTWSLSSILADPPSGATTGPALVLVLLGAVTKSAQVPFHSWLPGAMAAPTPVSAYLHSATMVKAGVYLIARFAPAFALVWGPWRPLVIGIGVATMLAGGWSALRQHDLKLLLAHGTVSQLGFMTALVGAGVPELTLAGAAVILAHGLFKAALFMTVGIVDHAAHSRDLRVVRGLGRRLPVVAAVAVVAAASMAGVPPLVGFVAKEAAFEGFLHADLGAGGIVALAGIVAGSVLTVAYGARFAWGAFFRRDADAATETAATTAAVHRPSAAFVAPAAVLTGLTLGLGLAPSLTTELVGPAAVALDPTLQPPHLELWHGFTTALVLSVAALAGGAALFAGRGALEAVQRRRLLPPAERGVVVAIDGLNAVASRSTAVLQNGSLPVYLGVILLTVLAVPGTALATSAALPSDLQLAESPLQLAVAGAAAVAAVAVARTRRRFTAVLCLGGVGYAVAVLFILQGAPDLALTQLLIETLALVIFVLVLRRLPERFTGRTLRPGRAVRLLIAGGVGTFVAAFALVAATARTADPVSGAHIERALPDAGGRNVVNVILVDFRGFDTMGEITVLVVAALGIAALVRAGRTGVDG